MSRIGEELTRIRIRIAEEFSVDQEIVCMCVLHRCMVNATVFLSCTSVNLNNEGNANWAITDGELDRDGKTW